MTGASNKGQPMDAVKIVIVPVEPTPEMIRASAMSTGPNEAYRQMLAAAPASDYVAVSRDVIAFLRGEAPLEGVWFGEKHPTEKGNFWWRTRLRAVLEQ